MKNKIKPDPLNREPPLPALVSSFITTNGAYNRNHSVIPPIDESIHLIQIDGEVPRPSTFTIRQLKDEFPQHEVVCALQCAGNRRHTMRTKLKEVEGVDWLDGAMMNCKWKGPRLRDVLLKAGVKADILDPNSWHVVFACYQAKCQDDDYYGGSIELWRAMQWDREVILALEMNDKPLTPEYGYPVRVVVPGVAGARWVKWLDRITVQKSESPNFYQQHDYKILPPEALNWDIAEEYWAKCPSIQCMPVNSVVAVPEDDKIARLSPDGFIDVRGYAVPSGEHGPITRVEISGDEGVTWVDAQLLRHRDESKWSWMIWQGRLRIEKGPNKTIYSRATDAGGNTQPGCPQWNLRGVCYNGYGASWNVNVV